MGAGKHGGGCQEKIGHEETWVMSPAKPTSSFVDR